MTDIKYNNDGSLQISDDVIYTIVETAALEVEGVSRIATNFADEIIGKINKNFSKGINVVVEEREIFVVISIIVKTNFKVYEVAQMTQNKVKEALETMTNLKVAAVNVNVLSIDYK